MAELDQYYHQELADAPQKQWLEARSPPGSSAAVR
jgi:hypothetical protein